MTLPSDLRFLPLPKRALARVSGSDARPFLQNIVSNDLERLAPDRAIYAALLTPQGHWLHDFVLAMDGEDILIESERSRQDDLLRRLTLYRLRSDVTLAHEPNRVVVAGFGFRAPESLGIAPSRGAVRTLPEGLLVVDPRHVQLGVRGYLDRNGAENRFREAGFLPADDDAFDRLRLTLGIPDGTRDLVEGRSFLLESNFDTLDGVSFSKGCYVGQENTARQRYRGTIRRRLVPVSVEGPTPEPGTVIRYGERDAGTMRSSVGDVGLALLRLLVASEAEEAGVPLSCGEAMLRVTGSLPGMPEFPPTQDAL